MSVFTATNFSFDSAGFARLPVSFQRLWIGLLVGAATVASAAFACAAPFAAVAMLAAAPLPLRQALAVTAALWLGNQIVGYGLIDYPVDGESISWGIMMGAASLAATFIAHRAGKIVNLRLDRCIARGLVCSASEVLAKGPSDHHPMVLDMVVSGAFHTPSLEDSALLGVY